MFCLRSTRANLHPNRVSVHLNFVEVARGDPLIHETLAHREDASLVGHHVAELIGQQRINKRAYGLSRTTAKHHDWSQPRFGRTRAEKRFDRVSENLTGHIVDVGFQQRELLRRLALRDLPTEDHLSEKGESIDLKRCGAVADGVDGHRWHRPERLRQRGHDGCADDVGELCADLAPIRHGAARGENGDRQRIRNRH